MLKSKSKEQPTATNFLKAHKVVKIYIKYKIVFYTQALEIRIFLELCFCSVKEQLWQIKFPWTSCTFVTALRLYLFIVWLFFSLSWTCIFVLALHWLPLSTTLCNIVFLYLCNYCCGCVPVFVVAVTNRVLVCFCCEFVLVYSFM